MLAKRADKVFGQVFALVDIAADLAYPAFDAFRLRLRLDVLLIIVIRHRRAVVHDAGFGHGADEKTVSTEIDIAFHFERHERVYILGQVHEPVIRAEHVYAVELVLIPAACETVSLKYRERRILTQTVDIHNARALNEVFYLNDFLELEKEFPNFSFHLALDRPDPAADAAGVKYTAGFVHQVIYNTYLKDHEAPEDIEYYMCGPGPMSKAVEKMLYDLGVPSNMLMYDNFGG